MLLRLETGRIVVERHAYDGAGSRVEKGRMIAQVEVVAQIVHLGLPALVQPAAISLAGPGLYLVDPSEATRIETQPKGFATNLLSPLKGCGR